MHQRNVIRNAITAVLLAAKTDADDRVFPTQKLMYALRNLPAISVYSSTEKSTLDDTAPRELTRIALFTIESIVKSGEGVDEGFNVDDEMDNMAEQIERAMDTDPYLGGQAFQSHLVETDAISQEDGDRQLGILTMTYQVSYRTFAFVPPENTDEFKTADTTYNLGNEQDPADQTSDEITVQSP